MRVKQSIKRKSKMKDEPEEQKIEITCCTRSGIELVWINPRLLRNRIRHSRTPLLCCGLDGHYRRSAWSQSVGCASCDGKSEGLGVRLWLRHQYTCLSTDRYNRPDMSRTSSYSYSDYSRQVLSTYLLPGPSPYIRVRQALPI